MIYLHIPFCKQACHYCDFHFSTSLRFKDEMIQAMVKEIHLRKHEWTGNEMETIYLGGGTPSLLSNNDLEQLFTTIRTVFPIHHKAEITLEANPDDITLEKLNFWKKLGINRLSIGIQSFRDRDLSMLNRAHQAGDAVKSVLLAQKEGFTNITVDLIYGIPGLSEDEWENNLDSVLQLNVQHISAYCLTVEARTALHHMVQKKEIPPVDDDIASSQFLKMVKKLGENGFIQYEISNFGKEGYYSRHNSAYWKGVPYLGIGPSAHSFTIQTRKWNIANNKRYIDAINAGKAWFEEEMLDDKTRYNEYIMTGLRTVWGINQDEIRDRFGEVIHQHFMSQLKIWENSGYLEKSAAQLRLSPEGRLLADRIASDLFLV